MNVIIALCGPQGYFLLFESMLDTVLFARDKWLKDSSQRMIKSLFTLLVENRFCIIVFLSFLTDLKVGYIFHKWSTDIFLECNDVLMMYLFDLPLVVPKNT